VKFAFLQSEAKLDNSSLLNYLKKCLFEFLQLMTTGADGIPVFDPWFANGSLMYNVKETSIYLVASGTATKVESVGFAAVNITALDVDYNTELYNMSLYLKSLDINGSYALQGSYFVLKPIVGNGPFKITLFDVTVNGHTTLNYDGSLVSLNEINLDSLSYRGITAEFDNLVGFAGDDANYRKVTAIMATQLTNEVISSQFSGQLADALTEYLNKALMEFNPTISLVHV